MNNPNKQPLSPSDLHNFFDVDYESGKLFWKHRERSFFLSDISYKTWNGKHSGKEAFTCINNTGYKSGLLLSKPYLAHRIILAMKLGKWPEFVDHIDGNRTNNKISNLRDVAKGENARNVKRPIHNSSGHIGVSWNNRDKRWTAFITIHRKRKSLGNFKLIDDAIKARKDAEVQYDFHENHGR